MSNLTANIDGASGVSRLRRYTPVAILIGAGVALSILAYIIAQNWERERLESEFRERAVNHMAGLEKEIARNMEVLRSITALYDASREVERQEFQKFVEGALAHHADIQALEWIPRVKDSERAAYEQAARRDGFPGFQFTEREEQGQMVRASRRKEYFPVYYVEPLVGNETSLGFDLASNPTRLEALERSRDTGAPVATARIKLVQETEGQFGFLIFVPVYCRDAPLDTVEERRQNLMGFALGVFRIGDLVEESLKRLDIKNIALHVYDNTAEPDERSLYSRLMSGEEKAMKAGPHFRALIDVADRQWSLLLHPTSKLLAAEKTFLPVAALGGGLLLTALIAIYLLSSLRHVTKLGSEIGVRKRVERTLVEKHNLLLAIIEGTTDAVFVKDVQGRYIMHNSAGAHFLGKSVEEIIGKDDRELSSADTAREIMESDRQIMTSGETQTFEDTVTMAGVTRTFLTTKGVYRDNEGKAIGVIGISHDITKRKQAERLFETMSTSSPVGIYILQGGKFILVNPQFKKLTGYSESELLGTDPLGLPLPEDRSVVREMAVKMLKGERSTPYEYRIRNKSGETRWILETVAPIEYKGRRAVLGNFLDITECKRAEEKVRLLSFHDSLTGLYNRAYFEEELKRMDTNRQLPLSLIIADVNGLKLVNDGFGHREGDKLLVGVAQVLKRSCRKEDVIARWGGDEYAILLPQTNQETATKVCDRITEVSRKTHSGPIPLTIALGSATKVNEDQDIQVVAREAEDRMYRHKLQESKNARRTIFSSLQKSLGEGSYETKQHVERLRKMALKVGRTIGLSQSELDELALLAALHDIGKLAIPDDILMKPASLSPEEWKTVRKHSEIGYRIAESIAELTPIAGAILSHHERWDGTGYPRGLKGEEIPVICRIVAIVDAYDVMTHVKPYRKPMGHEQAIEELKKCAGGQFDPKLVEIFVKNLSGSK